MKIKSLKKVGILLAIVVLPAFFFLSAHFLGENEFGLPHLIPLGSKKTLDKLGFVVGDSVYHQVADFSFIDENNNPFMFNTWKGKMKVVNVIFTNCKTTCPQIISNLTRASVVYTNDPLIGILSISVDPARDSASVLKKYKELFAIDNANWKFLNAKPNSNLYLFLTHQLFLSAGKNEDAQTAFFHSNQVVLIDADNVIRGYYDGSKLEEVDDLIGALKIMKKEYE